MHQSELKIEKCYLRFFQNIKFLARQSLPLRGSWDQSASAESNSNLWFCELRNIRRAVSPQIQNEMIEVLALGVLREISQNI